MLEHTPSRPVTLSHASSDEDSEHQHEQEVVLVVDDDSGIANFVDEFLTDEGFAVTLLRDRHVEGVRAAIERLRPDCVLLDGDVRGNYGASWGHAAWMTALRPPVPVIMFSTDQQATTEATTHESERSQAAGFSSVILKPFNLEDLLQLVIKAVAHSPVRA